MNHTTTVVLGAILMTANSSAVTIEKVAYGTEAGFFEQYGVPGIICGPGSIEQAHKLSLIHI